MPTSFRSSISLFRPRGHVATSAAYFAEGINQVALDVEVRLPASGPNAYVQFWLSPEASGDDWIGPYAVGSQAVPSGSQSLVQLASAGPNGNPVYTTSVISLGKYTGVVRWRAVIVAGNQDVTEVPEIFEVRLRKTQSVVNSENPPRYWWLRNDVPDETHTLSLDLARTVNLDVFETADLHKLVAEIPADPFTVQSDARPVVNPSDLLRLDINPAHNARTATEDLAGFSAAPLPAADVTSTGLSGVASATLGRTSTLVCQGANGAGWWRKMTSGSWSGLGRDFDVSLDLLTAFGNKPAAMSYGNQKLGVALYTANDLVNPWDGTIVNYVKLYVADDGRCHLEARVGSNPVQRFSIDRPESNRFQAANGILRLIRNGTTVSAFYTSRTAGSDTVNAGGLLVGQVEIQDDLHLSVFTDGATDPASPTTHVVSLMDSVAGDLPFGVECFVSNDDGSTWTAVTPGVAAYLGKTGTQLRWRVDVADSQSGALDLQHLALHAWAYRQADYGTVQAVSPKMKQDATANGGGTYTTYLYWRYLQDNDTLILFDEELRESTPLEALLAKVEITLDADGNVTFQKVTNYKNKLYLSAQGSLLHESFVLETDVDADGFFTGTHCKVVSLADQKVSGDFALSMDQPLENGLPVEGRLSLYWNETPYLLNGTDYDYPWSALAGQTLSITDPVAGKLTIQVGLEMPATLPQQDVVRLIDSRPGTDGIQEQVWLGWARRPTVLTAFDGHPETGVIPSSISHEGFTTTKRGGMPLPDGKLSAGFWRAETQW